MNPELDLVIERVIRAPRATVWNAWTDPEQLAKWWLPKPEVCRIDRLELVPGGAFVTSFGSPGGELRPHLDGCFLAVEDEQRIVFTTGLDSDWRPARGDKLRLTADITFSEHTDGTLYRSVVQHADPTDRARHEELGFAEGWGTVIAQLAELVEAARVTT